MDEVDYQVYCASLLTAKKNHIKEMVTMFLNYFKYQYNMDSFSKLSLAIKELAQFFYDAVI